MQLQFHKDDIFEILDRITPELWDEYLEDLYTTLEDMYITTVILSETEYNNLKSYLED